VTMLILLFLSGMPSAEGDNQLRFMKSPGQAAQFALYRSKTSPIIPLPPPFYAILPSTLKALLFFEWKMYAVSQTQRGGGGNAGVVVPSAPTDETTRLTPLVGAQTVTSR